MSISGFQTDQQQVMPPFENHPKTIRKRSGFLSKWTSSLSFLSQTLQNRLDTKTIRRSTPICVLYSISASPGKVVDVVAKRLTIPSCDMLAMNKQKNTWGELSSAKLHHSQTSDVRDTEVAGSF